MKLKQSDEFIVGGYIPNVKAVVDRRKVLRERIDVLRVG